MNTFKLILQDATHVETIDSVRSFLGEDASGQFGIMANHQRMMTVLVVGLSRVHLDNDAWQYIALPGAVMYFENNILNLNTRKFLVDKDYENISHLLQQELLNEEKALSSMHSSLRKMEENMLRLMWDIN